MELLYDHVSRPHYKDYHQRDYCGYHYGDFNKKEGKAEFRDSMNEFLRFYSRGYELSEDGEVLELPLTGLEGLLDDPLPTCQPETIDAKVEVAIRKFRRFSSSPDDRTDAVRTLADVLEYLKPQAKMVISSSDESDLFNIANNFNIRHHNSSQKINYDRDTWLEWVFYTYLATIRTMVKVLSRNNT